jgi:hypothetical protein
MKHSHLRSAYGHLLYVKTSLFALSLKLQDWLSLHSLGLVYPHIVNFVKASLILATVWSLVVTCMNYTAHSFVCLLLTAHFFCSLCMTAGNQAFSLHSHYSSCSGPCLASCTQNWHDSQYGGWFMDPYPYILPHGMKHVYWNIYWAMCGWVSWPWWYCVTNANNETFCEVIPVYSAEWMNWLLCCCVWLHDSWSEKEFREFIFWILCF